MSSGRSIVLIHYAGHGYIDHGALYGLERANGRKVNLEMFMLGLAYDSSYLTDADLVDVVFILDCCYAHHATRAASKTARIVEILAATDDNNPEAFAPPRNTLTGKLKGEIARRKRDGHKFVEFAEVMQTLRSKHAAVKKPTHSVKLGACSVCLPFSGLTTVDPSAITPSLRAVFSVHIARNMSRDQLDEFVEWFRQLPPGVAITLEGAYETNLTLLIIQDPYSVYSKLAGIPGISLISETTSANICRHDEDSPSRC